MIAQVQIQPNEINKSILSKRHNWLPMFVKFAKHTIKKKEFIIIIILGSSFMCVRLSPVRLVGILYTGRCVNVCTLETMELNE